MAEELLLSDKYKAFIKHDAPVEFLEGEQVKTAYGYKWEYAE